MTMRTNCCPCCGSSLLRHARQSGVYWFCTSCWQEVPLLAVSQIPRMDSLVARTRQIQPVNS